MNILNIATILPYDFIKENDVIFKNANSISEHYNLSFFYIRPISYSNSILALLSEKYKKLKNIPNIYEYKGVKFQALKGVQFPRQKCMLVSVLSFILMNKKLLKDYVKENNINIVHAHYIFPDGLIALYLYKKYSIPYVITVRDESKYFNSKSLAYLSKLICENAKSVICVSEKHKAKLAPHIKKVSVIPHWIKHTELHQDFNVSDKKKILCVSNFIPRKNIDLILKSLEGISHEKYELTIIGDGEQREYLHELANELSVNVNFTGQLPYNKVIDYMKQADIFILVSENETFGRVYIEAMGSSNLVIGLNDTGLYGLVNDEMIFIDSPDFNILNDQLSEILNSDETIRDYKIKGFNCVQNKMTDLICTQKFAEIYEKASQ